MEEILLYGLKVNHQNLKDGINQVRELLSRSEVTKEDLLGKQIHFQAALAQFSAEFDKCLEKIKTVDVHLFKGYYDDKSTAINLITEMEVILRLHDTKGISNAQHSRLPKLDLAKFNGNIINWNAYWDQFEANVDKKTISDAEKLSYLLGSLEGTAREAIEGLETTNINYAIAVDILKNRFGKIERVVDAHNEALHSIPKSQATGMDCRRTLNSLEKHLRVLEAMGEKVDSSHLRVVILSKFPENVLYQVNLLTANDQSIISIRKALDTVIMALERSEGVPRSSGTSNSQPQVANSVEALHMKVEKGRPDRKRKGPQAVDNGSVKFAFRPTQARQNIPRKRKASGQIMQPTMEKKGRWQCLFCKGQHYNDQCQQFKTVSQRRQQLKGKCYLCLRPGHTVKSCTTKINCCYCKRRHNRALCTERLIEKKGLYVTDINAKMLVDSECLAAHTKSFLQTATVMLQNKVSREKCRVLLDSGSQRTYITTGMANKLKLNPDKDDFLIIYTFGSDIPNKISSPSAEIELITKRGIQRIFKVNIVPYITDKIPVPHLNISNNVDVVADDASLGETVDMLIGNDYYFSLMKNETIKISDNLYLVNTDLGWIVSGNQLTKDDGNDLSVITYCQCHESECPYFTEPDLPLRSIDMKFLWSLESIGITDSPKTSHQEEAVKHFNETVEYRDGRYQVKWPWVDYPPELPSNFGLAYGRLRSLLNRLDTDTFKDYEEIIQEQLKAGVIEIVNPGKTKGNIPFHYLPHHIVKQPGKRGRIVYDASAKIKGQKSLNECLYKGPSMLEDMTALLLKFRIGKIGIVADVEKAFLQVGLQEDDREVTRFLWIKDLTKELTEDNLIHLRFCRVPFGIISSPFLLTATIRYHMGQTNKSLLTEVADRCYVDNLVTTARSTKEARKLYNEIRQVFGELSIREWTSNSDQFLESIPVIHRSKNQKRIKVLGLMWDRVSDTLHLKTEDIFENDNVVTSVNSKREVLKMLARLYDPCGFVAPLILPAKLLFQELCIKKFKWDAPLTEEIKQKWFIIAKNLRDSSNFHIPRYAGENNTNQRGENQLHCFTDASKNAYAAVVYLRTCNGKETQISFLMSKARVTPAEDKDDLKIPRLELLGFLIGNRLLNYVKSNLGIHVDQCFLWTDSLIVLSWMKTNKLLPPFVLRRINEIKQNKDVKYCYINTNKNPADLATRPDLWNQKKSLWCNGPDFLSQSREFWPDNSLNISLLAGEALVDIDGPEMTDKGYEETSSTIFEENEVIGNNMETQVKEVSQGMESIDEKIRKLQAKYFSEEVSGKETHLTRNLGLFLDVDGILRCKGRMANTDWTYDKKHPILIPRDCNFTNEVILETHLRNYHVGVSHTLSLIRQSYWIPQGRAQVQKVLKKCPQCVRHGGGPYKLPVVPPLPAERVNFTAPFTFTGMDYFGPMFVSTARGNEKRWVCLYTCLAVRAIHLEVVNDLTAEECLLALRRFTATRGIPKMIVSDNAPQFKLTSEMLSYPYCVENSIKWKFIPQLAPWHGGFYERLVALVKHCLKRTLDKHMLRDPQLLTVLKEVEAVVNTRPLTSVGSELEHVLKPIDFLCMGQCLETDSSNIQTMKGDSATKTSLVEGWKRGQKVLAEFKKMFQDQYLPSLRERYTQSYKQPRIKSKRTPQLGDIVQIKEDHKHRQNWKVGKIISLITGRDGECRVAKVKVGETEFTRSLGHLYPLELGHEQNINDLRLPEPSKIIDPVRKNDIGQITLDKEADLVVVPNDVVIEDTPVLENDEGDLSAGSRDDEGESSLNQVESDSDIINRLSEKPRESEEIVEGDTPSSRCTREAAIRAKAKIAEWTRQLMALM